MRWPSGVEIAGVAALFAAYPAFVVAEHHDLLSHDIAHYGIETVTVVVLGNWVWFGTVNSPAATWARGRAGKAWHRVRTFRTKPLPPPTNSEAATAGHPAACQCRGSGLVPCPFTTADVEV